MHRPLGVTVLSIGMILAAIAFAASGIIFFFMGSTGATATAPQSGGTAALFAALGAAAGIIFLLFGALHFVLAIAIFQMRNLARIFTIFLFILTAAGACLGLVATLLSYSHIAIAWNASILVVDLLALWYLLRPETKAAFQNTPRQPV
jgi:hypothetical protein